MLHGGKRSGSGRPRGSENALSQDVKGMVLSALDELGGQDFLTEQARENPVAFLTLIGKMIPRQVNADIGSSIDPAIELEKMKQRSIDVKLRLVEDLAKSGA